MIGNGVPGRPLGGLWKTNRRDARSSRATCDFQGRRTLTLLLAVVSSTKINFETMQDLAGDKEEHQG